MNKANKHWLAGITIIVVVSLMLAGCNVPGSTAGVTPTPEAAGSIPTTALSGSQGAATPTRPADNVQHIIEQAKANLAALDVRSYVITETYSARSVIQEHAGMGVAFTVIGQEQLHTTTTVWYQKPDRWRTETTKTSYADQNEAFAWPPVQVSDGKTLWRYDAENKIANVHSVTSMDAFTQNTGLDIVSRTSSQLNELNSSCYNPPALEGTDTVLGRPAYMIASGGMHCPAPILSDFMGKRTLWFDQQTGLLLKDVLYYPRDNKPLNTWQVTGLQLNVAINPSIFTFALPAEAKVVDDLSFHPPIPTPVGGQYPPQSPITVAEARRELNFPIFIPTYVPAGLTAELPTLNSEGPGIQSLQLFYHDRKGQVVLEVLNSTPDKISDFAVQSSETVTLANGITAYFSYGNILVWQQDGTYIAIGNPPFGLRCSEFTKQELTKIANSMSPTADLGQPEVRPTAPPTTLGQLRQEACQPVFIPTYVPVGITAEPPDFGGSSLVVVSGVRVNYHTSDGAVAFSVVSAQSWQGDIHDPYAMNVTQVTLPNGSAAHFFVRPVECGEAETALYWQQDGALIIIEGPPPDSRTDRFQLTKAELIKIATSVSSTAELGKTEYPSARPTELPQPEETAPSCTPPLPQAVPSHGPVLPVVEPTNHP